MADTGENPQQREQGPRREQMERRSTGAQTGADGAAGQRDAGRDVRTANSVGQSDKTNMMLKYGYSTGVLVEYDGRRHGAGQHCQERRWRSRT